jgi:hypothetical protein
MSDEGFLRRWARRKSELRTEVLEGRGPAPAPVPEAPRDAEAFAAPAIVPVQPPMQAPVDAAADSTAERSLPTMDDVAALDADSDFSGFVARGVDQAVRRSALKKLFADPHFNAMDGLDIYIDDYNQASPVSEAMLASLNHAKSAFMKMVEDEAPKLEQPPEQETQ